MSLASVPTQAHISYTFSQWGLTISTEKTKVPVVGRDAEQQAANAIISIRGDKLEVVSSFKYLGSIFTSESDGTIDAEVAHRIAAANIAFVRLRKAIGHHGLCHVSPSCSFFSLSSFQFCCMGQRHGPY